MSRNRWKKSPATRVRSTVPAVRMATASVSMLAPFCREKTARHIRPSPSCSSIQVVMASRRAVSAAVLAWAGTKRIPEGTSAMSSASRPAS